MSAYPSPNSVLTVDDLSQDAENLQQVIKDFRQNAAELSRHGYVVTINRYANPHPDYGQNEMTDLSKSKNKGSTLYWKDVRRIARERGITPTAARQVIRERQKRREGRSEIRNGAVAASS